MSMARNPSKRHAERGNLRMSMHDLGKETLMPEIPAATIMVVDDSEMNRMLLARRLEQEGHRVVSAENGRQALELLARDPIDLILLDIMMPEMNGNEVLQRMKSDHVMRHVPVLMISANDEMESVIHCIELGAEDYLTKPINAVLLKARVGACLEKKRLHDREERLRQELADYGQHLEDRVRVQVEAIASAHIAAIFAMSKLAESKDPETGAHLERMREYCKVLAKRLSRFEKHEHVITPAFIDAIYAASPLHDVGKVGVPDNILLKPGKLTGDEWAMMKKHTRIGAETLRAVDREHPGNTFLRMGVQIAEGHHEKWNGTGYPNQLSGDAIPLPARILALGDVYDALTSTRCYKEAFTHERSRQIILEGRATHFDPDVVDAFLDTEDEFLRIRSFFQDPEES
jgi:putative two-component system response regulator